MSFPMADKQLIKVLLIEDNFEIANLIRDMLLKSPTCNFAVTHKSSLKPALEFANRKNTDIIVLDLTLEDSEGFPTFFSVHSTVPDIPIIVLTGVDDEEMAIQAVREGAQDYLVKSHLDMHLFFRAMQYAIERHRIEEALRRATSELERRVKERTAELTLANRELQIEIEERTQAQSQLIQAAKMEVVGRLSSGVAHEVRNPLAIILQAIEYLESVVDMKDETVSSTLKSMSKALTRADTIINGLLDFSRISQLEMKPVNINDLIESSILLVKYQCDRYHIRLEKDLTPNLPLIQADKIKIEQVFVNLLMNSVDAMPNGGSLRIETSIVDAASGKGVCVRLLDSGCGIPPDIIGKVFDPFFTTKRVNNGTGLGLSIVKSIIEMHKGSIEITNRSEGGITATLLFPV
jgi:C4-dicarboxylate-specific signal transduction histidine kinase